MTPETITAITGILAITLIPAIKWAFDAQREAGKAEAYKTYAEAAIASKNAELDAAHATITELTSMLMQRERSRR